MPRLLPMLPFGCPNAGVFVRLNASNRASSEASRKIAKFLNSYILSEKYPGPRNWFLCVLPKAQGTGFVAVYGTQVAGAANEAGLNHVGVTVALAPATECVTW